MNSIHDVWYTYTYIIITIIIIGTIMTLLLDKIQGPLIKFIGLNICRPANRLPDGVVSARFATTFWQQISSWNPKLSASKKWHEVIWCLFGEASELLVSIKFQEDACRTSGNNTSVLKMGRLHSIHIAYELANSELKDVAVPLSQQPQIHSNIY